MSDESDSENDGKVMMDRAQRHKRYGCYFFGDVGADSKIYTHTHAHTHTQYYPLE